MYVCSCRLDDVAAMKLSRQALKHPSGYCLRMRRHWLASMPCHYLGSSYQLIHLIASRGKSTYLVAHSAKPRQN